MCVVGALALLSTSKASIYLLYPLALNNVYSLSPFSYFPFLCKRNLISPSSTADQELNLLLHKGVAKALSLFTVRSEAMVATSNDAYQVRRRVLPEI